MISTEELDQILKDLPYSAGGWASETIRKLVEEVMQATAEAAALRTSILNFIECDRLAGGEPQAHAMDVTHRESDSVAVSDFVEALSQPGPGAALLERLQKAEQERDEWLETVKTQEDCLEDGWIAAEKAEARVKALREALEQVVYVDNQLTRNRMSSADIARQALAEDDKQCGPKT